MLQSKNAFEIKRFMAVLMVLDHLDHIPGLLPPALAALFHALTRCVGAWFAYAAVEGFCHTRSRARYTLRLFLWAGIMAAGNLLYNGLAAPYGLHLSNNIFFTLALGVLCLDVWAGRAMRPLSGRPLWERLARVAGAAGVTLLAAMTAEGGIVLLPLMLISYGCRHRIRLRNGLYLAFSLLLFCGALQIYPTLRETLLMLGFNSDFLFITVLPVIALYNGQRGPSGRLSQYFFYVFYPLHLWVIGFIALLRVCPGML